MNPSAAPCKSILLGWLCEDGGGYLFTCEGFPGLLRGDCVPSVPLPLPLSLLLLLGVGTAARGLFAASPWDTPQPALRVPEWTLKHRNYSVLNFCSLLLRYAHSSRVNKAALVFFLLLSLFEKCISAAYGWWKRIASRLGSRGVWQWRHRIAAAFGTWRCIAGTRELWVKRELKLAEMALPLLVAQALTHEAHWIQERSQDVTVP